MECNCPVCDQANAVAENETGSVRCFSCHEWFDPTAIQYQALREHVHARNREIVRAAIVMVAADGELEARETSYLGRLAGRLGLDAEEANEMIASPGPGGRNALKVLAEGTEADRLEVFSALVGAAMADGELEAREAKLLWVFFRALKLEPDEAAVVIGRAVLSAGA